MFIGRGYEYKSVGRTGPRCDSMGLTLYRQVTF